MVAVRALRIPGLVAAAKQSGTLTLFAVPGFPGEQMFGDPAPSFSSSGQLVVLGLGRPRNFC
jgi:hypothetical protein